MPRRLGAFVRSWLRLNDAALNDLGARLRAGMDHLTNEELGKNGLRVRDVHPREWMFKFGMLQYMRTGQREDPKHCDGGASLVHMGLSLFGGRTLRWWEKDAEAAHEAPQRPGYFYVSNPGAFEHQVVHYGTPVEEGGLIEFGDMGPCKLALQLRCSVFGLNRGTKPPAKPMIAFKAASSVVASWLRETNFAMPTAEDCEALLRDESGEP